MLLRGRIPETYSRLLVPIQDEKTGPAGWRDITLQGTDALAPRAAKKLRYEELLMAGLGGVRLRLELDRVPLWRGDSVSVRQLAEDFAQYLYLPRLKDEALLLAAIAEGVAALTWREETFAYAEGYDEARWRYLGLKVGQRITPSLDSGALLVKPAIAAAQLDTGAATLAQVSAASGASSVVYPTPADPVNDHASDTIREPSTPPITGGNGATAAPAPATGPKRFHGLVEVDPQRAIRDMPVIVQEVVQHLTSLYGAKVRLTLEITADIPDGTPDYVVRTVTENCRTLKFTPTATGFEEE